MKAILVLTDFSSEANYVAEFAISLALLVPEDSEFEGLKTILYASDLPMNNKKALQFLADLAKPFKATVKVGHIANISFHGRRVSLKRE